MGHAELSSSRRALRTGRRRAVVPPPPVAHDCLSCPASARRSVARAVPGVVVVTVVVVHIVVGGTIVYSRLRGWWGRPDGVKHNNRSRTASRSEEKEDGWRGAAAGVSAGRPGSRAGVRASGVVRISCMPVRRRVPAVVFRVCVGVIIMRPRTPFLPAATRPPYS